MAKKPEITLKNIYAFFQGNLRMLGDRYNRLPAHQKEQVLWRLEICKDTCVKNGKCQYCGCKVPGKLYATSSCNGGKKFPNLMMKNEWEMYKKINNIK